MVFPCKCFFIMNIESIFDECVEYSLDEKASKLLEAISNLETVKDFTDDFASDEDLDHMLEEMRKDKELIPKVLTLLNAFASVPNNATGVLLEEFI